MTEQPKINRGRLWPRRIMVGLTDATADRAEALARKYQVPMSMVIREAAEAGMRHVPNKLKRMKRPEGDGINVNA